MKLFKYPLMIIALILIIGVIFWDDLKVIYTKTKNMAYAKFNSNINNPFNIRANASNKWTGKTTKTGAAFESFDKLENGVRAGIKILKTYFEKYNLHTVKDIISRFAPNNENDTENYINFVSKQVGVTPDQHLTGDKETMRKLSKAICKMENGYNLTDQDYEAGFKLA